MARLERVLAMEGENPRRNGLGPVGVYQRNTFVSKPGYDSLKAWEEKTQRNCGVVVTVGTYAAIARFAAYARYKGESWIVSAVSFTGADNFEAELKELNIEDRIVMTQVVPPLNSTLPIVSEARERLGDEFGYVTLEGFIVGKLWLKAMGGIQSDLTRQNFLASIKGTTFDLGGMPMDFSDDNQGSDLVVLTYLTRSGYRHMDAAAWRELLAR